MKTNAIIRIILFSLAILILLGILIAGLGIKFFMFDRSVVTTSENQLPIASDGTKTQTVVDSSAIRELEVEWAAGNIILEPYENATTITISESYTDNAKNRMVVEQSGNKLKIQYCEDSIRFPSFGLNIDFSKDLIITVPANWFCNTLDVDAASANVTVMGLSIGEVEMDSASGICKFLDCNVNKLDIDAASGDILFFGTLNELDFDGASGNCNLELTNVPNQITMDGISGDLNLILPQEAGFTVSVDAISGNFQSDFPFTVSGNNYLCGNGQCRINFGGISGEVYIHQSPSASEATHSQDCSDPNCTDASHNHGTTCNDINCTDASHNHGTTCNDSNCTDTSHNHQTNHTNKETHHSETEHR